MNNLNLPNPKMMDVAVPANMRVGLAQEEIARTRLGGERGARRWRWSASRTSRWSTCARRAEREKHGVIPGSLHAPYPDLQENIRPGGMLHELARATGKRIVFYCAFGERSAMAVQAAQDAGLAIAPATSRAASTPGRRPAGRSCAEALELNASSHSDADGQPLFPRTSL